jgi:hypothetical protein
MEDCADPIMLSYIAQVFYILLQKRRQNVDTYGICPAEVVFDVLALLSLQAGLFSCMLVWGQ